MTTTLSEAPPALEVRVASGTLVEKQVDETERVKRRSISARLLTEHRNYLSVERARNVSLAYKRLGSDSGRIQALSQSDEYETTRKVYRRNPQTLPLFQQTAEHYA